MADTTYSIQILNRGEQMLYKDRDLELELERTYCEGHRLFCDNTSGANGPALGFSKRQEIIRNLCGYFDTKHEPTIFVLDEGDKDRAQLEQMFAELVSEGHKITVEFDSAEQQADAQDEMYLGILEAGKKLSINGVEIESAEDYWRWKRAIS